MQQEIHCSINTLAGTFTVKTASIGFSLIKDCISVTRKENVA